MSDSGFYDGCVELTPAASTAIGAASGVMTASVIEVGTGGFGTPVAAAAGAAVGATMQDQMENGGWESTCAAVQSAWDSLSGSSAPDPAPTHWLDGPAYSPDMASTTSDSWVGSSNYGGDSGGDSGGFGGDSGGGGSSDGGSSGDA